MSVDLMFKHQQKTYELIKEAKKQGIKRIAYIYPTGAGKTFPGLKEIEDEIKENPNKNILIVVSRISILQQYKKYISKYILEGDKNIRKRLPNIRFITYSKLVLANKMTKLKPDMIYLDEIHRIGADTYGRAINELLNNNPEADVRASTATPDRPDGRNMADEIFGDNVIYEMSMTEALTGEKENEVVLKAPNYFTILSELKGTIKQYKEQIDEIEDVEIKEKLYKNYEKLERTVANSPDIEDVMNEAIKKKNAKCLVICADREDMFKKMEQSQKIFGKVNDKIKIDYLLSKDKKTNTGKTKKQNNDTLKEFEEREKGEALNLLFCVDMVSEGVHIDGIDVEVQFQETESPLKYKQWIGRVMRAILPGKNKREQRNENDTTVIVDAVNNWLRQIDTYREIQQAIIKGQKNINMHKRNEREAKEYNVFKLRAEQVEFIDILKEIEEISEHRKDNVHNKIMQWLETHEGKLPRSTIIRGKRKITIKNATEEEKRELRLYDKWHSSEEFRIYKEYQGKSIEVVPEEYREKIKMIRKYNPEIWDRMFEWYNIHDGREPRADIKINGRILSSKEMTLEENEEVNLRNVWKKSKEKKILEQYRGVSIEDIPTEYRGYIEKMRKYGKGLKIKTSFEETIEWIETHNGIFPRNSIRKRGERQFLKKDEMTEKENNEVKLRSRWNNSQERKIFDKYKGKIVEEIPVEYRKIIIQIQEAIQKGKDEAIVKTMKKAVTENVETNQDVRVALNSEIKKLEDYKSKT